jgi:LysR family glycine cleavage system transcriptional activator
MRAPNHLNALRAFEAVSRHLSYVAAADELNVTPAAVGQLIRGLEEILGVELFHRSPSGPSRLVLTDAARAAIPDLQAGFDLLSVAMERLRASKSRTPLTFTLPPAFADKWFLPRVARFQARHPYFDLRVDLSLRLLNFHSDRVDAGIRYGSGQWEGLAATFLLRDQFFPVCSPALRDGPQPLKVPQDLHAHRLIHDVSMQQSPVFPTWQSWLRVAGAPDLANAQPALQINDSAAALQAAIAGHGVALGRSTLVERDLAEGRLVAPFEAVQSCEHAYYVIHRPERGADAGVVAIKEWLLEEAGGQIWDSPPSTTSSAPVM